MKIGRYTITQQSLKNKFLEMAYGINSKKYWNGRYIHDWESNSGPLQTAIFAAGFCQLPVEMDPKSVLDYGAGGGDSVPLLKIRWPKAEVSVWDFSFAARTLQSKRYGKLANVLEAPPNGEYDLVYSSNVIEHIEAKKPYIQKICSLSSKWVAIQAPQNERHEDGELITPDRPKGEHIWTINKDLLDEFPNEFMWTSHIIETPFAWDGKQVIFIGGRI